MSLFKYHFIKEVNSAFPNEMHPCYLFLSSRMDIRCTNISCPWPCFCIKITVELVDWIKEIGSLMWVSLIWWRWTQNTGWSFWQQETGLTDLSGDSHPFSPCFTQHWLSWASIYMCQHLDYILHNQSCCFTSFCIRQEVRYLSLKGLLCWTPSS